MEITGQKVIFLDENNEEKEGVLVGLNQNTEKSTFVVERLKTVQEGIDSSKVITIDGKPFTN